MALRATSAFGFEVSQAKQSLLAEETLTTRNCERNHNPIATFQFRHRASNFDDLSHRLVAEHVALFHCGHMSSYKCESDPQDRGRGDFYDCVSRIDNRWVWNVLYSDIFLAVPPKRSHV